MPAETLARLARPQEMKWQGDEELGSHPVGHHQLGVDGVSGMI